MSEAGWTTDKPKAAGWYWVRDHRFVLSGNIKLIYITTEDLTRDWGKTAEFLGPITPDDAALTPAAEGMRHETIGHDH